MSAWTYYSPLWLGAIIAGVVGYGLLDQFPPLPAWALWSCFAGLCLLAGLQCQLALIGAQGIFAQVLPVPRGRSVRGEAAVLGGALLLGWVVLSAVAGLLWFEDMLWAPLAVGGASLLCLAGAAITYVWCWPTAARDFV